MTDTRLIDRLIDVESRVDKRDAAAEGAVCELVQTVEADEYPTRPDAYYAVSSLFVDGEEVEGGPAAFTPDPSRTFRAYNVGSRIPPEGAKVLVSEVGGRWVFRYDGGPD